MESATHTFSELFKQLGLPCKDKDIKAFISDHKLAKHIEIEEAPFWTTGQASFIKEAKLEDSDWVELIDRLDAQLRPQLQS